MYSVNPANQGIDRDMKLPTWDRVDLTEQGKATVIEPMSLYFLMQCLLNGSEGRYTVKALQGRN